MTTSELLKGTALGVALWFFAALSFGVLVEAALPAWSSDLRTMASAAFLPMALVGALVMVRQGLTGALLRFTLTLAVGGVLWFFVAAVAGWTLGRVAPQLRTPTTLNAVNAVVLALALVAGWRLAGRLVEERDPIEDG